MAMRTVRLDEEDEVVLRQIREATGLPVSGALKRGLRALRARILSEPRGRLPYEIYQEIALGPGQSGAGAGAAGDAKAQAVAAIRRKYGR